MERWHTLTFLYGLVFVIAYKLTAWYCFSGPPYLAVECATSYGGIASGQWSGFIQSGKETCGQAAAAFFLTTIGRPESEAIRSVPTLHYIVIKGIREDSIWTRYFSVYDPDIAGIVEYTSTQLKGLMTMPDNTPAWVYEYPKNDLWISDPCYRLLVYGN